ncbi:MAG: hypothetical protein ACE5JG_04765 [Planctomycetota bacterium]
MLRGRRILAGALLALGAGAAGGGEPEAQRLVAGLGSSDPRVRTASGVSLLHLGPRAWPALEAALGSDDPHVRVRARQLLRLWGWVPPRHRTVLSDRRVAVLRGTQALSKRALVVELVRAGGGALRALRELYAGPAPSLRLEPEAVPPVVEAGATVRLGLRLKNTGSHPGWAMHPHLSAEVIRFERFGRPVVFPAGKAGARRAAERRAGRSRAWARGPVSINNADRFRWLEPGEAWGRLEVEAALPEAGVARVHVRSAVQEPTLHVRCVDGCRTVLPDTRIEVACEPSVDPVDFAVCVLPPRRLRGSGRSGCRLDLEGTARDLRLRLSARRGGFRAPADLSSFWYAVLDGSGRVVAHGAIGPDRELPVRYPPADLVPVPAPPGALVVRLRLPSPLPPAAYRLVAGGRVSIGRRPEGTEVASPIVHLSVAAPQPRAAGRR